MEKLVRQLTIKYAFLQGTFWISQCSIYSFAAVYLKSIGFQNVQIGMVMASAAVLSIFLQPLIAAFADKTVKVSLRTIVITLMFIVLALSIALKIFSNSFYIVAILYVLINAIQFTYNPLFNSLAIEYINKGVPLNYGLARGLGSICFAVMSSILGLLVNHFGPDILLNIFIISYLVVIVSAFAFKAQLPESITTTVNVNKTPTVKEAPTGILMFFIKYKKFTLQLIGLSMLFYANSMINTYLINIIEDVGGNSANMGVSLSIAAGLELPMMAAFIYLVKKIKCSTLLKISAFFFIVKVGIAYLAPNVLTIYISQSFQFLAFALFTPVSVYYVNSIIDEKDKVKGQAMLGVATSGIAASVSSLTGGRLLDSVGVKETLLIGVFVTIIGFLVVFFTTETVGTTEA